MIKTIALAVVAFLSLASYGQYFEGKIVYKNSYSSRTAGVTDEQLNAMLGSVQEYYIKDGDYKSVINGSLLQSQLYTNKDNKLYSKMSNSEEFLWNDGATNTDEVLKSEINKGVIDILGYKCDELILTCKSGVQKFYFNSRVSVNIEKFKDHKFGNFYEILSRANALPLKAVMETQQFVVESTASEVIPMKLEKSFFELPPNAKTVKSPY